MNLFQEINEMAKSKSKRRREAKRAIQRKDDKPTLDDQNNPVAKFAQTSGAGAHDNKTGNLASKKRQRKEGKAQIEQALDN